MMRLIVHCLLFSFLVSLIVCDSNWEVFSFYTNEDPNWTKYDWNKLTSLVIFNEDLLNNSADLMTFAHSQNVSLSLKSALNASCIVDSDCRVSSIEHIAKIQSDYNLDGVNVDVEWPANKESPEATGLVSFMSGLRSALKNGSQLSIDVPWSPNCIDGRCYDFLAINDYVDLLFVMAYDEQSQMGDPPCVAKANSPPHNTINGLTEYLNLGIPRNKLILGLPWYGYDYPCLRNNTDDSTCYIREVPFRNSTCSDAAGSEKSLGNLLETHSNDIFSNSIFEPQSYSMRYRYNDTEGVLHEVWYDNPKTLAKKYHIAVRMGLRGVGFWNINSLYYGSDVKFLRVTHKMWNAVPSL